MSLALLMGPESLRTSALTHESRGCASFMRHPSTWHAVGDGREGGRKEAGREPAQDISLAPSRPSFVGCIQGLAE